MRHPVTPSIPHHHPALSNAPDDLQMNFISSWMLAGYNIGCLRSPSKFMPIGRSSVYDPLLAKGVEPNSEMDKAKLSSVDNNTDQAPDAKRSREKEFGSESIRYRGDMLYAQKDNE